MKNVVYFILFSLFLIPLSVFAYIDLQIDSQEREEMRLAWIHATQLCDEMATKYPNYIAENYGHFYNCQNVYINHFEAFDKLYDYCSAMSMAKYPACVELVLGVKD